MGRSFILGLKVATMMVMLVMIVVCAGYDSGPAAKRVVPARTDRKVVPHGKYERPATVCRSCLVVAK